MELVLGSVDFGECASRALRMQPYPKCDFFLLSAFLIWPITIRKKMFLWQILVPSAGLGQTLAPWGIVITLQRIKMEKAVTERAPVAVCIPGNAAPWLLSVWEHMGRVMSPLAVSCLGKHKPFHQDSSRALISSQCWSQPVPAPSISCLCLWQSTTVRDLLPSLLSPWTGFCFPCPLYFSSKGYSHFRTLLQLLKKPHHWS